MKWLEVVLFNKINYKNMQPDMDYLTHSLTDNRNGKLSEAQKIVILKMFKMRSMAAWIMIICGLLTGLPSIIPLFLPETEGKIFFILLVFTVSMLAIAFYGFKVRASQNNVKKNIDTLQVKKIVSTPSKRDYSTPAQAPYPGMSGTFTIMLSSKAGWIKMNNKKFGVIPGHLYSEIEDGKETEFYYLELGGVGFHKNLIVNIQ
jgi:hypothetical protein